MADRNGKFIINKITLKKLYKNMYAKIFIMLHNLAPDL